MKLFASFASDTQRYVRRSLDIGLCRSNSAAIQARNAFEASSIREQARVYGRIDRLRNHFPDNTGLEALEQFMSSLVAMTAFDLAQEHLPCFSSYRFLYERLLGAAVRPWLASAFCAAAALPSIHPELRWRLLRSVRESDATLPGWSNREPAFFPEWVDEIDISMAA
jgi:hypothetical protein